MTSARKRQPGAKRRRMRIAGNSRIPPHLSTTIAGHHHGRLFPCPLGGVLTCRTTFLQRKPGMMRRKNKILRRKTGMLWRKSKILRRKTRFLRRKSKTLHRKPSFLRRKSKILQRKTAFLRSKHGFLQRHSAFVEIFGVNRCRKLPQLISNYRIVSGIAVIYRFCTETTGRCQNVSGRAGNGPYNLEWGFWTIYISSPGRGMHPGLNEKTWENQPL